METIVELLRNRTNIEMLGYTGWCEDTGVEPDELVQGMADEFRSACRAAAAELIDQRSKADGADFVEATRRLYPDRRDPAATALSRILSEAEDQIIQIAIGVVQDDW